MLQGASLTSRSTALAATALLALGAIAGSAFLGVNALKPVRFVLPDLSLSALNNLKIDVSREEYADLGIQIANVSLPEPAQVTKSVPKKIARKVIQRPRIAARKVHKKTLPIAKKAEILLQRVAAPQVAEPVKEAVLETPVEAVNVDAIRDRLGIQSVVLALRGRARVLNQQIPTEALKVITSPQEPNKEPEEESIDFAWAVATAPLAGEGIGKENTPEDLDEEYVDHLVTAEAAPVPQKTAHTVKRVVRKPAAPLEKIKPEPVIVSKAAVERPVAEPSQSPIVIATASQLKAIEKGVELKKTEPKNEAQPQKTGTPPAEMDRSQGMEIVWDEPEPEVQEAVAPQPAPDTHRTLATESGSQISVTSKDVNTQKQDPSPGLTIQNGIAWNFNGSSAPSPLSIHAANTPSPARIQPKPGIPTPEPSHTQAEANTKMASVDEPNDVQHEADEEESGAPFVEAFDPKVEVQNVHSTILSHEGDAATSQAKWVRFEAQDHWNTIAWSDERAPSSVQILSQNATVLLSKLIVKKEVQTGSGIVFGRIAPQWIPQLIGRSEEAVLLDEHLRVVAEGDPSLRYFVFLNVAPGLGQVYLKDLDSARAAYITGPVLPNTATFLDLTRPRDFSVTGKVRDASSSSAKALAKVQVQLAGIKNSPSFSSKDGTYVLKGTTFGSYPVYMETDHRDGYTHRYLYDTRRKGMDLFRFGNTSVEQWYTQSTNFNDAATKGIAIGAFPKLSKKYNERDLVPMAEAVGGGSSSVPRAMALSLTGVPLSQPMEPASPRMVASDLAEGLNLISVRDEKGQILWSSYMVFHPNIVFVVGPN